MKKRRRGQFPVPGRGRNAERAAREGHSAGLVTNKPTPFVAPLLEALDIAKYFSVIVGGDDVQNKKPHPEPLLLVAGKLSLTPAELLFVGDSRNDILAARAAAVLPSD
jgi:phosphoglycolate phosphatase